MLSAGDVQGCLRKLEALLRAIKYAGHVDYNGLSKGDPSAFLPIVSFTLTSFSPPFSEQLIATGHELTGKTDLRFTDTLYKVLRDIFHYKPILTKQQFLQWGFSQRKISVLCDIINLVLQKHNQLKKPRVRCPASNRDGRGDAHRMVTEAETVSDRPFVVNHTDNPHTFAINIPNVEAVYSHSPGNGSGDLEGGKEDKDHFLHSSKVEERLSALEAQLESLSGLHKINVLEKRLEELERQRNTDVVDESEGQLITISKENWDNLTSRVLLLETKMELSNTQSSAPPPCPPCSSSCSSHPISDASKEDLKDRLERITNMLKSTSVLLKNTESPTTPCK